MIATADAVFAGLPVARWGTVVWVGAPDAPLPTAAGQAGLADRWVVVVGEDAVAARLRAQARALPWVTVRHAALAAQAGQSIWHRYNFPHWNGLIEADGGVRSRHPRLQEIERSEVQTESLGDFLQSLSLSSGGPPHALVLDGSANTGALLDSLSDALVTSFEWIVAAHVSGLHSRLAQRFALITDVGRSGFMVGRLDPVKLGWIERQSEWQAEQAGLQAQLEAERRSALLLDERLVRAEAKLDLLRSWIVAGDKP